jgi:hypothetical protein
MGLKTPCTLLYHETAKSRDVLLLGRCRCSPQKTMKSPSSAHSDESTVAFTDALPPTYDVFYRPRCLYPVPESELGYYRSEDKAYQKAQQLAKKYSAEIVKQMQERIDRSRLSLIWKSLSALTLESKAITSVVLHFKPDEKKIEEWIQSVTLTDSIFVFNTQFVK